MRVHAESSGLPDSAETARVLEGLTVRCGTVHRQVSAQFLETCSLALLAGSPRQWGEGSLRGEGLIGWPLSPQGKRSRFWQFALCLGPGPEEEQEGLESTVSTCWAVHFFNPSRVKMPFWLKMASKLLFWAFQASVLQKEGPFCSQTLQKQGLGSLSLVAVHFFNPSRVKMPFWQKMASKPAFRALGAPVLQKEGPFCSQTLQK